MRYVLGIDGGGTKTECVLADEAGTILGIGRAGPCNINFVAPEDAYAAVRSAAQQAVARLGDAPVEVLCVGAPAPRGLCASAVSEVAWVRRVAHVGEVRPVLAAAGRRAPVAVVIAGTGALAFADRGDGRTARADALGAILGDEGSAFDIGWEALRATARHLDGRGPATALSERVLAAWDVASLRELVEAVYRLRRIRQPIAALASRVDEVARSGDAVAESILVQAGHKLATSARAVLERCGFPVDEPVPVVVSGSVLLRSDIVREAFGHHLRTAFPAALVEKVGLPPSLGAALFALELIGVDEQARAEMRTRWRSISDAGESLGEPEVPSAPTA